MGATAIRKVDGAVRIGEDEKLVTTVFDRIPDTMLSARNQAGLSLGVLSGQECDCSEVS